MSSPGKRNLREKATVNYKILNETGEKVLKDSSRCEYTQRNTDAIRSESESSTPTSLEFFSVDSSEDDTLNDDCTIVAELAELVNTCLDISGMERSGKEEHPSLSDTPQTISSKNSDSTQFNLLSNTPQTMSSDNMDGAQFNHISDTPTNQEAQDACQQFASITDDISDHLDEHTISSSDTVEDIDGYISRIEHLRTECRKIHRKLMSLLEDKNLKDQQEKDICIILNDIKGYILTAKQRRSEVRDSEVYCSQKEKKSKDDQEKDILSQKSRSTSFLLDEINRLVAKLNTEFKIPVILPSDQQLERISKETIDRKEMVELLSTKLQHLIEVIPEKYPKNEEVIKATVKSYDNVLKEQLKYETFIKDELAKREEDILKRKRFNTSKINIEVPKFGGYNSPLDFFTFKSQFEKLCTKDFPAEVLPDLLKNNYLKDPALSLVKRLDKMKEIWDRLQKAYGDPRVMLSRKLMEVRKLGPLQKIRDAERYKVAIGALLNSMYELKKLSRDHGLLQKLYHGEALDVIIGIMGDRLLTRWISKLDEGEPMIEEQRWANLTTFLEKELRIQEEKSLLKSSRAEIPEEKRGNTIKDERSKVGSKDTFLADEDAFFVEEDAYLVDEESPVDGVVCFFCGESNHPTTNGPNKTKVVQYFACQKFVDMNPSQRFKELFKLGYCFQCLFPGAKGDEGKHAIGICQSDYICKHESHEKHTKKKHVLLCQDHCQTEANLKLFDEYKSRFITPMKGLKESSKNIQLSYHSFDSLLGEEGYNTSYHEDLNGESGIYMFQRIGIDKKPFNIFFDTGCSDFVSRFASIQRIKNRIKQVVKGPLSLGGVGECEIVSPHGVYEVKIPIATGRDVEFFGVCLEAITTKFPLYPIQGEVETDIKNAFIQSGGDAMKLPSLPKLAGGNVDFMIGIKYNRYHPTPIFTLPSGLTIYKSHFLGFDGSDGLVGGPHKLFSEVQKQHKNSHLSYLNQQYKLFEMGFQINPDNHLLSVKNNQFDIYHREQSVLAKGSLSDEATSQSFLHHTAASKQKQFEEVENAGSKHEYRCPDCRNCVKCRNGERIESISIREEVEQNLIEESVTIDLARKETVAYLPFVEDPNVKLAPNKNKAMLILSKQMNKLNKNETDKKDVVASERKLQDLGHVDYLENLPPDTQKFLKNHPVQHYIAWLAVWNSNSITTPCRVVFHGSLPTPSSYSLNDLIAKGRNSLNKLVEIFIRWRCFKNVFHTDVQKMYNSVKLKVDHWCFQRYLWIDDLDPGGVVREKIIKTIIYGIKSSGNQAECALRKLAKMYQTQYPEIYDIIMEAIYMDDCLSGTFDEDNYRLADELSIVLKNGGFSLKGFTFSGENPLKELSEDGESIKCAGVKWFSMKDQLQLNDNHDTKLKKQHGNLDTKTLTRADAVGMVARIFDLTGMFTPLIVQLKLDLHELVLLNLDWKDAIPDNLRSVWSNHAEMIKEINNVRFRRAVVPDDAKSMEVNTVDVGDASMQVACAAVYVRFPLKSGGFSCQLLFARSKLLRGNMTQPRAELAAAYLNAHTGEVVRRALVNFHKYSTKLTDSKIALSWICNKELQLKQWTRNRVIEICRFSDPSAWMHIKGEEMIADIATRKGAVLSDVLPDSNWVVGLPWMSREVSEFPGTRYTNVTLSNNEKEGMEEELVTCQRMYITPWYDGEAVFHSDNSNSQKKEIIPKEVEERYKFSKYLIDPNKHRFNDVVRIMAIVLLFVKRCRQKRDSVPISHQQEVPVRENGKELILSEDDIAQSKLYFFRKATLEVKHFNNKKKYTNISFEKDDILYLNSRILQNQNVNAVVPLTDVMKDLSSLSFVVPMVDKHSPLAYSIINEVHWHHKVAKHAGVGTVWRFVLEEAYILDGRDLVKRIKGNCLRCRYLMKRCIDVTMGPVPEARLTIAPIFYITQVDLAGPFKAYSYHNKRVTLKIWLCVFCCATTKTVNIKVLEDYTTSSFLQAFIRLACEVGYPKMMYADEGSQLVKGCSTMTYTFQDAKFRLQKEVGVDFQCCPVGGHNFHGLVERKIRHVKESLERSLSEKKLSILQWETTVVQIANCINDLPYASMSATADLDDLDLLTPNRLRLGRNNQRSPVGPMWVTGKPDKFIASNKEIFNTWFETWLINCVPKLILQTKWFKTDSDISIGDLILFLKKEGDLNTTYQYGKVIDCPLGKDGKIRKVKVTYRNHNEDIDRTTTRAVRELIMIHPIEEVSLMEELGRVANAADIFYVQQTKEVID